MKETTEDSKEEQEVAAYNNLTRAQQQQRLTELATVFLRLGTIAFGGPAAHIAMIDQEVVNHRRWLTREKLLDLIGITNLIPGPNSTELAIHIGFERAGWRGLLIAGSCFILPAMLIVWLLAVVYVHYQTVPQVEWLLYGIKPVIIAIVLQALGKLGNKAAKDIPTVIAGIAAITGYLAGFNEILLLILLGMGVMLLKNWQSNIKASLMLPFSGFLAQFSHTTETAISVSWLKIFLLFLKIGFVLYGGGYVLLAFLQKDLVERYHWLTSQQLLDAVAIGQVTPGPLFTTATFIGYLLAGTPGALAATIGIFLPSFLLVWLVNPWVSKLRRSLWFRGFLDGVNAASLGLMAGVTYTLAQAALIDWITILVAIISLIIIVRFKINSVWLVIAGGIMGLISHLLVFF